MARPVERWLETFMCGQYAETFEACGYKTLQSVCQLDYHHVRSMGVLPEHCEKIMENVSVLRQSYMGMGLCSGPRYNVAERRYAPASTALAQVAHKAQGAGPGGMGPYGDGGGGPVAMGNPSSMTGNQGNPGGYMPNAGYSGGNPASLNTGMQSYPSPNQGYYNPQATGSSMSMGPAASGPSMGPGGRMMPSMSGEQYPSPMSQQGYRASPQHSNYMGGQQMPRQHALPPHSSMSPMTQQSPHSQVQRPMHPYNQQMPYPAHQQPYMNSPYNGGPGPGPGMGSGQGPPYGGSRPPGPDNMYNSGSPVVQGGGNVRPMHHHLRNTPTSQTPQQVADSILQMASSSYQANGTAMGAGPMRAAHQMMGMGGYGMRSMAPNQYPSYGGSGMHGMTPQNCSSPLSPMQVRSPASVHSLPSTSPGPMRSPAAGCERSPVLAPAQSPGMVSMCSPGSMQQSPASCSQQSMQSAMGCNQQSPVGIQAMQSPHHPHVSSTSPASQGGTGPYYQPMPSPTQQSHYSPLGMASGHSSPASYSSCSQSTHTAYNSPPQTNPAQSFLPGGSQPFNPLQSLQKLVMLPESQVVDPKSVVNDACLSSEGNALETEDSKNGLATDEVVAPVAAPLPACSAEWGSSVQALAHDPEPAAHPASSGGPKTQEHSNSEECGHQSPPHSRKQGVTPEEGGNQSVPQTDSHSQEVTPGVCGSQPSQTLSLQQGITSGESGNQSSPQKLSLKQEVTSVECGNQSSSQTHSLGQDVTSKGCGHQSLQEKHASALETKLEMEDPQTSSMQESERTNNKHVLPSELPRISKDPAPDKTTEVSPTSREETAKSLLTCHKPKTEEESGTFNQKDKSLENLASVNDIPSNRSGANAVDVTEVRDMSKEQSDDRLHLQASNLQSNQDVPSHDTELGKVTKNRLRKVEQSERKRSRKKSSKTKLKNTDQSGNNVISELPSKGCTNKNSKDKSAKSSTSIPKDVLVETGCDGTRQPNQNSNPGQSEEESLPVPSVSVTNSVEVQLPQNRPDMNQIDQTRGSCKEEKPVLKVRNSDLTDLEGKSHQKLQCLNGILNGVKKPLDDQISVMEGKLKARILDDNFNSSSDLDVKDKLIDCHKNGNSVILDKLLTSHVHIATTDIVVAPCQENLHTKPALKPNLNKSKPILQNGMSKKVSKKHESPNSGVGNTGRSSGVAVPAGHVPCGSSPVPRTDCNGTTPAAQAIKQAQARPYSHNTKSLINTKARSARKSKLDYLFEAQRNYSSESSDISCDSPRSERLSEQDAGSPSSSQCDDAKSRPKMGGRKQVCPQRRHRRHLESKDLTASFPPLTTSDSPNPEDMEADISDKTKTPSSGSEHSVPSPVVGEDEEDIQDSHELSTKTTMTTHKQTNAKNSKVNMKSKAKHSTELESRRSKQSSTSSSSHAGGSGNKRSASPTEPLAVRRPRRRTAHHLGLNLLDFSGMALEDSESEEEDEDYVPTKLHILDDESQVGGSRAAADGQVIKSRRQFNVSPVLEKLAAAASGEALSLKQEDNLRVSAAAEAIKMEPGEGLLLGEGASSSIVTSGDCKQEVITPSKKFSGNVPSPSPSSAVTPSKKRLGRPKGSKNKMKSERKGSNKKESKKCFDAYSDDESVNKIRKSLNIKDSAKKQKSSHASHGPVIRVSGPRANPLTCNIVNTKDIDVDKGSKKRVETVSEKSYAPAPLPFPLSDSVPWLCCFCGQSANYEGLGDLFGPYWPDNYSPTPVDPSSTSHRPEVHSAPITEVKKRRRRRTGDVESRGDKRPPSASGVAGSSVPERWVHVECASWSHGVYIQAGKIQGLEEAAMVASQTTCSSCSSSGATLGCRTKGCANTYHYLCATLKGCHLDDETFSLECPKHKDKKRKLLNTSSTTS